MANANTTSNRTIPIICYAEDWGRLPSSTQHLMRGLSKTHKILWVDSMGLRQPSVSSGDISRIFSKIRKFLSGIKEIEHNIFVLTPLVIPMHKYSFIRWVNKIILRFLVRRFLSSHRIKEFIQWSSCPTSAMMINSLGELANVYYIGDEFSEFSQFDKRLVGKLEKRLLVKSDLLLVVSEKLLESKCRFNPLVYKIPHGCDYDHFSKSAALSEKDVPGELRKIPGPIIGYFGLIRDWFDFEMLRDTFTKHRDWSLVLIGSSDTDTSVISDLPNVHFLGPKPYKFLPQYLKGFDICIIPYRKTEVTMNANPLKLLEYLSSGKPVITTDLPSVRPYRKGLTIVKTASEFEQAIPDVIANESQNKRTVRMEIAKSNSWQDRIDKIESIFDKHIYPLKRRSVGPVVMHLIAAMDIAGAEKVVLNLLTQKGNCEFDLRATSFVRCSDGTGTEFLKLVTKTQAVIDRIPMYKRWDQRDVKALMRIIRRHNVKILHTHGYKSDIVGVIASKLTGVPLIATSHGYTGTDPNLLRNEKLDRFFLRFASKMICVSNNIKETLINSGLSSDKILLLPNAVDYTHFDGNADIDFRKEWGIDDDEILIGSAGRLSVEKAHINLIKALAILSVETKNRIKLVIAGTGPLENAIRLEADKEGLGRNLVLTGFINDMRSFYKATDIFCLPSLTEGLPLTLLEAAASGKPIVASKVGSVGSLINDKVDGFTPEPDNIGQLSWALRQLTDSQELRVSMGERLHKRLKKDYDVRKWADKVFAIYAEILENKRG